MDKEFMRYPEGQELFYDSYFAMKSHKSKFLNGSIDNNSVSGEGYMLSLSEALPMLEEKLKNYEMQLNGGQRLASPDGYFEGIETAIKREQQNRFNRGEKNPGKLDKITREKLLVAQANYDVCRTELKHIQEAARLEEEKTKIQKEIREKPLKKGSRGIGKVSSKTGCGIMDFQRISVVNNTPAVIDDPRSPYDGMKVSDYLEHIVLLWKTDVFKKYEKTYEKMKSEGFPDEKIPSLRSTRALLLKWPEGVRNYKETKGK